MSNKPREHTGSHRLRNADVTVDPAWRKAAKAHAEALGHQPRKFHRNTSYAGHVSDPDVTIVESWSLTCRRCSFGLVVTPTAVHGPIVFGPCR